MEVTALTHLKVKVDPLEVINKLLGPYYTKEDGSYRLLMKSDLNNHSDDIIDASESKVNYYYGLELVKNYLESNKS